MNDSAQENIMPAHLIKRAQTFADLKSLLLKSRDNVNIVQCFRCGRQLANDASREVELEFYPELPDGMTVTFSECRLCNKICSLWCCDQWCSFEDILSLKDYSQTEISQVTSPFDHLLLFLLSQVCHNQQDLDISAGESPFLPPVLADISFLVWKDSTAVGFYSIKQKGSAFPECPFIRYYVNMVDVIYVRRRWRRLGLANHAIAHVVKNFTDKDVGFSDPVSYALLAVLSHYLSANIKMRDHLWICTHNGEPGYRSNAYLQIKALKWKEKRISA